MCTPHPPTTINTHSLTRVHAFQLLAEGAGPSKMVQALVKVAYEASVDKRAITPYAREASEALNMCFSGGKKDDITVLVAVCK